MTGHPLLGPLTDPDPRRGIRFYDGLGGWEFHPYPALARAAFVLAHRLREEGVAPGDVVVAATGSGPEFVAAVLGATAVGAAFAPYAPPSLFEDREDHRRRTERMLLAVRPSVVVTRPEWADTFRAAGGGSHRPRVLTVTVEELSAETGGRPVLRPPADRALVQFTSGSSGPAKAVAVSAEALSANIRSVRRWLRMGAEDATASWLPFHHDMGLIGCLLTPVSTGGDLWVMRPEDFLRSPVEWLRCFGSRGARLTASAPFGLRHVTRRVPGEALDGMDFADWRAVIVGAERIAPEVLKEFAGLLAPHGFASRALLPAYGLAEATLAVTGSPLDEEPRELIADRDSLAVGRRVRPADDADRAVSLVACGRPVVAGSRVLITDRLGRPLPGGHVGEIVVSGPSVAAGYAGSGEEPERGGFSGRQVRTGDSGFLHDGDLYVLGRLGDSLKCRGTTVFAEDLEACLAGLPSLRTAGAAVLLGVAHGVDTAVAVIERRPGPWAGELTDLLRRRVPGLDVVVVAGPRGTVLRTSSAKPRRRAMWDAYLVGRLGTVCAPDPPGHPGAAAAAGPHRAPAPASRHT
nr:non-ribosomal peptide synthetase 2 [Streptomyces sp.]